MKTVICVDKDGNEFVVPVQDFAFRPSVYGVIIQDDKILLVRQWDGYDFPGGGVELGEDITDALVREISEETGLKAMVGEIVACENSFFKRDEGLFWHCALMYYFAEVAQGELSIAGIDEREKTYVHDLPEWVPLTDIEKIKFYNSVDSVKIIQTALTKSAQEG